MTIVNNDPSAITSSILPNAIVNILPPLDTGVQLSSAKRSGIVGGGSWGALNTPLVVGTYPDAAAAMGPMQVRSYDAVSHMYIQQQLGVADYRLVRVSDGTDIAASVNVLVTALVGLALTGKYTGTEGNKIAATFAIGTKFNTSRVTLTRTGYTAEIFDNIPQPGTQAAYWAGVASAINNGQGLLRGPSALVIASVGAGAATAPIPAPGTAYALLGGTDGASNLTDAMLVGASGTTNTGMYALSGAGCSVVELADVTTVTTFGIQNLWALADGDYIVMTQAAGATPASVTTASATAAVDNYASKCMVGDWIYWYDPINMVQRLMSPQPFACGKLASLQPQQSGLNKAIGNIIGTQSSVAGTPWSDASLTAFRTARFDVICSPSVGGGYFSFRFGCNMSSGAGDHGDNYSRLTPYLARTINSSIGTYVGRLQSLSERAEASALLGGILQEMQDAKMIGNAQGSVAYKIVLNDTNNSATNVGLGYQVADVTVQYLSVIERFIVNQRGGQTVTIAANTNTLASAA